MNIRGISLTRLGMQNSFFILQRGLNVTLFHGQNPVDFLFFKTLVEQLLTCYLVYILESFCVIHFSRIRLML